MLLHARNNFFKDVVDLDLPDPGRHLKGEKRRAYLHRMRTLYGVFCKTIKNTQHGPTILSKYQDTMDARAVYKELREYYKFSVVGQATRAKTLNDLDLQLIDWRGTHLRFFN